MFDFSGLGQLVSFLAHFMLPCSTHRRLPILGLLEH